MIIQIYEIQTPEEAQALIELGVNRIGSMLLSEESWKAAAVKATVELIAGSHAESSLIPLFSTPDAMFRVIDYYQPDIIHFCESLADETGTFDHCAALIELQQQVKERFPEVRIMRSIPIARPGQADRMPTLQLAEIFEPVSDIFLTDTLLLPERAASSGGIQPVQGFVGITGKICDRDMARQLRRFARIPVILAGGLDPYNVADGLQYVRPAGVDSCTGTNARDKNGKPIRFRKDMALVKAFVENVRTSDLSQ